MDNIQNVADCEIKNTDRINIDEVSDEELCRIDDEIFNRGRNKLKKGSFRDKLYGKKYLGVCFAVPFVIMLITYIAMGVWPIGEGSVLVLDLNAQYIYFIEKFRSIIAEGGSFLFSFERVLGGEFMGMVAYYLASPFNLITLLFPKEYITEAVMLILLLKCGCCGLTFGIFVDKTFSRRRPVATIIFSSMYALTSFAVVMQNNLMWTDNIILLPLILLGIDRLIKHGKVKLYTVTVALSLITNFYIGYMTCIFVAIYFFVRYFTASDEERNPTGTNKHFAKAFVRILIFSIIAVMIAAVMIWSAYYSLSFGKLEFSEPNYGASQLFDFADIFTKLYFGSYDTVRPEGAPFLYAGMLMTLLAPLFFFVKSIPTKHKVGAAVLLVICLFSVNLSTLDLIWHGFQRPNWLNARFSYMFVMIGLLMAYAAFLKIREIGYSKVVCSGVVFSVILMIFQKLDFENLPDFGAVWASLGIIIIYLIFLRFTYRDAGRNYVETTAVVLAVIVAAELFASSVSNLYALDADVLFTDRVPPANVVKAYEESLTEEGDFLSTDEANDLLASYRGFLDVYAPAVEYVNSIDPSFFRSEKINHQKTNDNFALGIRGLSGSTSTLNAPVIEFLHQMGLSSKSHWSKYEGNTPYTDTFFGVKYLFYYKHKDKVPDYVDTYYELIHETDTGVMIYRNNNALSIAFTAVGDIADYKVNEEEFKHITSESGDYDILMKQTYEGPFNLMNRIFSHTYGSELNLWNKLDITSTGYNGCRKFNLKENNLHSGYEKNTDGDGTFTYKVTADGDTVYMYIPSEWPREVTVSVNGKNIGKYMGNNTHHILKLGTYAEGENLEVVLKMEADKLYLTNGDYFFYSFNDELYEEVKDKLVPTQMEVTDFSESHIEGKLSVKENATHVLTTIPYDEGWQVYCNGEMITYEKALDCLIAFDLPAGEYEIEFRYMPDSFKYGMIISVSGIVLFVVLIILKTKLEKKRATVSVLSEITPALDTLEDEDADTVSEITDTLTDGDEMESPIDDTEVTGGTNNDTSEE